MNKDRVEQLLVAERLFDWTVRNIQLDPLLPYVIEATAGPTATKPGDPAAAPAVPPYLRGIPGPGYQREPWLTLVMGHGDSLDLRKTLPPALRRPSALAHAAEATLPAAVTP